MREGGSRSAATHFAFVLTSLAILACSDLDSYAYVTPPDDAGGAVVYVVIGGAEAEVFAARSASDPVAWEVDGYGARDLWALAYDVPLEDLGLAMGAILVRESGAPLPVPVRSYARRVAPSLDATWSEAPLPGAIGALRVQRDVAARCTKTTWWCTAICRRGATRGA